MGSLAEVEAAFVRDIIAHHDDDGLRLIFADWLDDNGQAARAAYIREEVANPHNTLSIQANQWFGWVPGPRAAMFRIEAPPWGDIMLRRGMVAGVRCRLPHWLEQGPLVVQHWPLERVELSDRRPLSLSGDTLAPHGNLWYGWCVWGDADLKLSADAVDLESDLPHELFRVLYEKTEAHVLGNVWNTYHPSREDALDCLSKACLIWANAGPAVAKVTAGVEDRVISALLGG